MAQNKKLREQTAENQQYLLALNQKLDKLTARAAQHGEVIAALVKHLGEDVIEKVIADMRAGRKAKHEAELAQSVQFMLDNNLATPEPEGAGITANSFIVVEETYPDGTVSRAQHEMKRLDQEGQARYIGKKVGDVITNPRAPGFTVVVKAIYTIDMAKVSEFAAKKKAEAATVAAPTTQE